MSRKKLCGAIAIFVLVVGASPWAIKLVWGGVRGIAMIDDNLEREEYELFQYFIDKDMVRIVEDERGQDRFRVIVGCDEGIEHLDRNRSQKQSEKLYDPSMICTALQTWTRTEKNNPLCYEVRIWVRRTNIYPEILGLSEKDLNEAKERGDYSYLNLEVTRVGCKTSSTVNSTIRSPRPELAVNDCWQAVVNSQESLRFASHRMPMAFHDEFRLEALFARTPEALPQD